MRQPATGTKKDESVAVLPFRNLGENPASSDYFASGVHESILTHLRRIRGLKVISRASVMGYRDGQRNIKSIASELGVAHIVEGTIQRTGDRVKLTAQLIDSASDTPIWNAEYDRDLADIFAVQADLAQQIASAINARLTVEERALLEKAPTSNLAAYELYLRALEIDFQQASQRPALLAAIAQLEEAVTKDTQFALAHALLSKLHMRIYWVVGEYDKTRLPVALRHAQEALRLAPEFAEPHLSMALYWYWGHRDYPAALNYLKNAHVREKYNAQAHYLGGVIQRRMGHSSAVVANLKMASQSDPRSPNILQVYASTLSDARRFEEAEQVFVKSFALSPRSAIGWVTRLRNQKRWSGAAGRLEERLADFRPEEDPYCLIPMAKFELYFSRRQFAKAASTILACHKEEIGMFTTVPAPKEQFSAMAYTFGNELQRAKEHGQVARKKLEKRLQEQPDLPLTRMALAYMFAITGDRTNALAEADRALGDMPLSKDALVAAELLDNAAALHAYLGEDERALDELARALTLPNGSYAHLVQLNPFWDSLRTNPRFQKLMAEHLTKSG